jgi:hypothetical protein
MHEQNRIKDISTDYETFFKEYRCCCGGCFDNRIMRSGVLYRTQTDPDVF